ncbi:hypothetical protein D3C71_1570670 [compost metagenome]
MTSETVDLLWCALIPRFHFTEIISEFLDLVQNIRLFNTSQDIHEDLAEEVLHELRSIRTLQIKTHRLDLTGLFNVQATRGFVPELENRITLFLDEQACERYKLKTRSNNLTALHARVESIVHVIGERFVNCIADAQV